MTIWYLISQVMFADLPSNLWGFPGPLPTHRGPSSHTLLQVTKVVVHAFFQNSPRMHFHALFKFIGKFIKILCNS